VINAFLALKTQSQDLSNARIVTLAMSLTPQESNVASSAALLSSGVGKRTLVSHALLISISTPKESNVFNVLPIVLAALSKTIKSNVNHARVDPFSTKTGCDAGFHAPPHLIMTGTPNLV
jgi:hypothetical protein